MMKNKFSFLFSLCVIYASSQDYKIENIPDDLKLGANAVVRERSLDFRVKSEDNVEMKYKSVISILNKTGEDLSYVYIPYDKSTKISDVKVRIIDAGGKVLKSLSKGDLQDVAQSQDSYLYIEDRAMVARIAQAVFPYTIEYTYTARTSDTAFLPSLQPFISTDVSIQNWKVEFVNDSNIKLRKNITKSIIGEPNVVENGNALSVSFKDIPAIKEEKYSPDLLTLVSKVDFALDKACLKGKCGDFSTWQNLANWYQTLLDEVSTITPEIQQEVNALNLSGTTKDKVKTIYQYMQSKTRYVFVGIGIGGWQPMKAEDVRTKAYGDCKALTNYTRVLLEAAGIKSYYAKIYMDGTPILFDENFPKMGGNHVILFVPTEEGDIWLENTSQNIAFNHLGYSTRNRNVVLLDKDNTKLIETPKYNADDSFKKTRIQASISDKNVLEAKSQLEYEGGWYDFHLDFVSQSKKESEDQLRNNYYYLKFSKLDFSQLENNKDNGVLSYNMNFSVDGYSKNLGDEIYFNALTFANNDFYLDTSTDRKFPLEIAFGYVDDYEIEYTLPEGYKLAEFTLPRKIETDYGNYTLVIVPSKENKVLVKRKFVLNKAQIPVEKIPDYIKFRKQVSKTDATKLLIKKI